MGHVECNGNHVVDDGCVMAKGKILNVIQITRSMVIANRDTRVYVFGDNMARSGLGGQAASMRGEPNAIGIPTKWLPSMSTAAFFCDEDFTKPEVRSAIDGAFEKIIFSLENGKDVVIPVVGIGTGFAQLPWKAPKIYDYITNRFQRLREEYGDGA
jgi:hypothetical protein